MAEKIRLGTLFMDNEKINPDITTSYRNGTFISINSNDSDDKYKIEWVKVDNGSKHYLIATHNILNNISYNELNLQGLIKGINVTLDGTKYVLRVLSGGNTPRQSNDKKSKGNPENNEWDKLICNEIGLTGLPVPSTKDLNGEWTDSDIGQSDTNNLWHWYKTPSICQELNSNNCTIRGGDSIGFIDNISGTTKSTTFGWRPILEKYNYSPIVSDGDRNIGNYTMNIIKKYTVIDPDKELMEVKEYLDNQLLRTLPNVENNTEIELSLADRWDSLSNTAHTIKIIVTDTFGNSTTRIWTFNKLSTTSGSVTSLMKPNIIFNPNTNQLNPIDANEDNDIRFNVVGGDMIYCNELCITDNSDNVTIVYDRKNTTFDFVHTIPKGSLVNGKEYQLKLRTYNDNNQYSEWSNIVLMKTMSPISLTITNIIDGQINTQNPLFVAEYSQAEKIKVSSYKFILYKNGNVIDSSDEIFSEKIQYQFSNLENKETYTIQLTVKNVSGQEKTITQDFYCTYIQTRLNAILKTSMNKKEGSVKLETYIRQIIGYIQSGDKVTYINGEEADLHDTIISFDEENCFYLEKDWTMQVWARDMEDDTMLIKIYNKYGHTILSKYKNVFYLSSYIGDMKIYERYSTISGDIQSTDDLYFYIQYGEKNGFYNFEVRRVNNGKKTWFTPTHSDDTQPNYFKENGFLTNIGKYLKSVIVPNDEDLFRLPDIENLTGVNKFDVYNEIHFSIENTVNKKDGFVNDSIDNTELIEDNGLQTNEKESEIIVAKDNYEAGEPFSMLYQVLNSETKEVPTLIYLDGNLIKSTMSFGDEMNEFSLSDIWGDLDYEKHIVTIEINVGDELDRIRKTIAFKKKLRLRSKFEDEYVDFYTKTVSGDDLIIINKDGGQEISHANNVIGNRLLVDVPKELYVTKNKCNDCHILMYDNKTKNNIVKLSDLGIGEKIKDYRSTYNNTPIEFTIVKKNENTITLITDVLFLKEFDDSEINKSNGNNDWKLSNIRQWLKNEDKLVEN